MGNYYKAKGDPNKATVMPYANDLPVYAPPVDTLVDKLVLLSRSELYLLKKIDEAEKSVYPEWALKLVTHAMRYIPEDKYLISKALKLYLMTGKGDLAMPYLDKHLRNFGDDFTELISTGDILYAAGFYGQAADFYKHAAIIKPGDPGTRSNLALCLWNSGNRQQALTMTLDMTTNPADLESMTKGITLLMGFNETGKAKQYLASVTRSAPANPVVLKLQGMAAEQEGNTGRVIALRISGGRSDRSYHDQKPGRPLHENENVEQGY
jgi:tetratricopeptide (TPR) repeat protein